MRNATNKQTVLMYFKVFNEFSGMDLKNKNQSFKSKRINLFQSHKIKLIMAVLNFVTSLKTAALGGSVVNPFLHY